MRKHAVDCRIEEVSAEARESLNQITNEFYTRAIERILDQSAWEKEEQLKLIQRLIEYFQKNDI